METLKSRRAWTDSFQTLRDHRGLPRQLYSAKLSVNANGEDKVFYDKVKIKLPTRKPRPTECTRMNYYIRFYPKNAS